MVLNKEEVDNEEEKLLPPHHPDGADDEESLLLPQKGEQEDPGTLSTTYMLLFSTALCFLVGNIYYSQPLLEMMRADFKVSTAQVGLISTLTTVGYGVGLLLIAPLGDTMRRKPLIIFLTVSECVFLVVSSFITNYYIMLVISVCMGLATASTQIIVPMAVDMAAPAKRASAVGFVMAGVFLGILISRTISGAIGMWAGWRVVYWYASGATALISLLFLITMPNPPKKNQGVTYFQLIRTMFKLLVTEPVLAQCSIIGSLVFSTFLNLWTVITFRLSAAPYFYSSGIIGLFALVGGAGVIAGPLFGLINDRRNPYYSVGYGGIIIAGSFTILMFFDYHLTALIVGIFMMDFGVQAVHVSNQARIFSLDPSSRSRTNSVFMCFYFCGGSVGSALGSWAYGDWGWRASCIVAFIALGLAFLVWVSRRPKAHDIWTNSATPGISAHPHEHQKQIEKQIQQQQNLPESAMRRSFNIQAEDD